VAGGRTAAVLYPLVATCKHLGIDPFAYLREALPGLFALGEKPAAEQLLEWLPDRWQLRRARESPHGQAAAGSADSGKHGQFAGCLRRCMPRLAGTVPRHIILQCALTQLHY
jgi:hypothetical protein